MRRAAIILAGTMVVALLVYMLWPIMTARAVLVAGPAALPGPQDWFDREYRLEDGEFVRFVPPPFSAPRRAMLLRGWVNPPPSENGQEIFYYGPALRQWGISTGPGSLASAVISCGILTQAQIEIPPRLGEIAMDGDWIIRDGATVEQRLADLDRIIRARLKRDISIQPRHVRHEAIVARGRWELQPIPGEPDRQSVHFYVETRDTTSGAGGGTGAVRDFFQRIEDVTGRRVIDQTQSPPQQIVWRNHNSLDRAGSDPKRLRQLLDNTSQQTSLTFTLEPRDALIYAVTEGTSR